MLEINKIYNMDCLEGMKLLDDNSIDAIVTDPPYSLGFMGKDWDTFKPQGAFENKKGFKQLHRNNMKELSGFQQFTEQWAKEALRVLKPGGHLLSFGGSRTYHRMACAIEDAGFQIRDQIMWVYGSGFSKSLNIGKAVDKLQGNEREVVGKMSDIHERYKTPRNPKGVEGYGNIIKSDEDPDRTKGNSEWEGWGTALKPAHEPIVLARKPLSEKTVAENCLKWGTGGINIDGCRVEYTNEQDKIEGQSARASLTKGNDYTIHKSMAGMDRSDRSDITGRFPANFIHDGSQEVLELFPDTKSSVRISEDKDNPANTYSLGRMGITPRGHNDSGSAARFFYVPKASKEERNKGLNKSFIIIEVILDDKGIKCKEKSLTKEETLVNLQVDMEQSQLKVIEEYGIQKRGDMKWSTTSFGKNITEKFQKDFASIIKIKTNSTILSQISNWLMHLLIKEYIVDVKKSTEFGGSHVENVIQSNQLITTMNEKMVSALGVKNVASKTQLKINVKEEKQKCSHPTVKPIALIQYLIKLITPPDGIVMDPFIGSGTTAIAAYKEHKQFIGFEKEQEYFNIAEARIKHYTTQTKLF